MKFKDIRIKNKRRVKKEIIDEIKNKLMLKLDSEGVKYNHHLLDTYISDLIDCTDYEPEFQVFYQNDPTLVISTDLFVNVAHDFINSHIKEYSICQSM